MVRSTYFTLLLLSFSLNSFCQDFSNKGTDFWVGYGSHVSMYMGNGAVNAAGGSQEMVLYITSTYTTNFKVEIPGVGWSYSGTVAANSVVTTPPIPKLGVHDARLATEGKLNRGIHITGDMPVVAYAHIYNQNVSGATLLFPTPVLGREYYSVNFAQYSNEGTRSYCFFFVVATEDNTRVQIIPTANTLGGRFAGVAFDTLLMRGEVYNVLSTADLTGSKIQSISTGVGGCKKIAVFSGTGKISITNPVTKLGNADNVIQQAFPASAWGKKYLTVPTEGMPNNFYRVVVSDPTTVIKKNGAILSGLTNNFYYQFLDNQPNLIEADKPIIVAQYVTTGNNYGNNLPNFIGDPEMIYLSSIEQTLDNITLNSTPYYNINPNYHYINVVLKTSAINSFTLDGAVTANLFEKHPGDTSFSYAQIQVNSGAHNLKADSGFAAIAYGFGPAESYGYNAGANIIDLYQYLTLKNQYATINFPVANKNSQFLLSLTLPYQPTFLKWEIPGFSTVTQSNPICDTSFIVNDKQLFVYKLPDNYVYDTVGTYKVKVSVNNPTPDGCGGLQEILFDLHVVDGPSTGFKWTGNRCANSDHEFQDTSNTSGRSVTHSYWDFGDGTYGNALNATHKYTTAGTYTVKHFIITDIGGKSDTLSKQLIISDVPRAKFAISQPSCFGKELKFFDSSKVEGSSSITDRYWNFGDGKLVNNTTGTNITHTYANAGTYQVSLKVKSNSGCESAVYTLPVTTNPNPVAKFSMPQVCLPEGIARFKNISTITDDTESMFTYQWNFGDTSSNTSSAKEPVHTYNSMGPYNVKLIVTSNKGCVDSSTQIFSEIYAQAKADFNAVTEICFNPSTVVQYTDQSKGNGRTITNRYWNFDDGITSILQNPSKTFTTIDTFNVKLYVQTDLGCHSDTSTKAIIVHPLPVSGFKIESPLCENNQLAITDTSKVATNNIQSRQWNFGDSTASFTTSNGSPFLHRFSVYGNYTISLLTKTDKGCENSMSKTVAIHPLPKISFALPEVCLNDAFAQFTDSSSIVDNSAAQFSWLWNFGDINTTPVNPNISIQKNAIHKYTNTGYYDVKLSVTSKDGCVDSLTKKFTINGGVPKTSFVVSNSADLCSNTDVQIIDESSVNFGSITKLEVFWDWENNPSLKIIDEEPIQNKSYTHLYPDFQSPSTKDYQVRLLSYSGETCVNEMIKTIKINNSPKLQFNIIPPLCLNDNTTLILKPLELASLAGSSRFSGTGITDSGLFNPAEAGTGAHTIRYTWLASNGCTTYEEQPVFVKPIPTVNAGADLTILEGGTATINATATGIGSGNLTYLWTPHIEAGNRNTLTIVVSPKDDTEYTLRVNAENGCSVSDNVAVKVLKLPTIPNTFTPNGDGINDRWEIQYMDSYRDCIIEVYNTVGRIVYRTVGYKPWDGTYNGQPLPVGTYYYVIDPKYGRKKTSGYITILR